MELFDEAAVLKLNAFTMKARKQIEELIKAADVPVSLTGAGSMFRLHFQKKAPKTYRDAYQDKATKAVIDELLDYLFLKKDIIMINTLACMFSTSLTQDNIDRLSEALFQGLIQIKPKLDQFV